MTILDLPTYVSISEAIERYHLGREALTRLVEAGRVRAVEVDGEVAVAKEDVGVALMQSEIRVDENLRGQSIRLSEAARKYDVSDANLVRWTEAGYIRIVERGPKLLVLDESDVEFVVRIFKHAREETGSSIRAGWILRRTLEKLRNS
jgi:predicted site-specific integrase-resolvase